eukprot:CAMPEP_0196689458 /NCGR_PEP_ID=MMETSP1090-20130531/18184_1 /TAXON_ID=37098 /ORGANISM="Isochrysis sp, Strain CCMP1244" /LENGTH=80 /DNA_ID=CAMNT_0042028461 /DNA_START=119 /DNA_END=358 /DNA_ORIENTATION=-
MARVAMKGTAAAEPAAETGLVRKRRPPVAISSAAASCTCRQAARLTHGWACSDSHDRVDQLPSRPRAAAWRACSLLRPLL